MKKTILFDLDDTLVCTHDVFHKKINELKYKLVNLSNTSFDEVTAVFKEVHEQGYNKYFVEFNIEFPFVINELQKRYGFNDIEKEFLLKILFSILETPLELKEGAVETLEYLKSKSYNIGLVTHALSDWTDFKLDSTGLRKYFSHIQIADPSKVKSSQSWLEGFRAMKCKPEEGIVVGDNKTGDIKAAFDIGTGKIFWLNNAVGWSVYNQGELPEGVIEIKKITELIEYLK